MKIIAHRGQWNTEDEKNGKISFERAIRNSLGIETDIRDCCGKLVISHNVPQGNEMSVDEFLSLNGIKRIPLALNIKSDGLQNELINLLQKKDITDYFVFDMSVPDMINYIKSGINIASRHSEYEKEFPFYQNSTHIWLDCFNSDWFNVDDIKKHLTNNRKVCVVSPELHKRDYKVVWQMLKTIDDNKLMICTDLPKQAKEYFNE